MNNTTKFQIQVSEIDNGIIIQTPGETETNKQTGQQLIVRLPSTTFCKDVEDLCQTLQRIWPRKASNIELLAPPSKIVKR